MARRNQKGSKPMQTESDTLERTRGLVGEMKRQGKVTATAERLAKVGPEGYEETPAMPGHRAGQRVLAGPLDRLWKARKITSREYEAGERCRSDAYLAHVDPIIGSVDWAGAGGGGNGKYVPVMFTSEVAADATRRWRRLEHHFRPGLIRSVIEMGLVHEHSLSDIGEALLGAANIGDARNAGYGAFRAMLAALADFYDGANANARPV